MNITIYTLTAMKFFSVTVEICITAIKRFNYSFKDGDTNKKLKLIRNFKNKWDKNAIQVHLEDKQIGYIKKEDAQILSPVLKTNTFYVKKWGIVSRTDGYLVIQCVIRERS